MTAFTSRGKRKSAVQTSCYWFNFAECLVTVFASFSQRKELLFILLLFCSLVMPSLPPRHILQWLRECFTPEQPQAKSKVISISNCSIHQMHSRRLGQSPFIPQHQKPTDASKHHHNYPRQKSVLSVRDYIRSVLFSRENIQLGGAPTEFPSQTTSGSQHLRAPCSLTSSLSQ